MKVKNWFHTPYCMMPLPLFCLVLLITLPLFLFHAGLPFSLFSRYISSAACICQ